MTTDIDFTAVLFGFPEVRQQLPKPLKARVLLWHSIMIHLIWTIMNRSIKRLDQDNIKMDIDFTDREEFFHTSFKSTITQIHHEHKSKNRMENFRKNWVNDCQLWTV